jgi:hypothetical protein
MGPAIEEALRKSGVVWVDLGAGSRIAWPVWHEGALWLVCGGLEQDLPGARTAERASVVVRAQEGPVLSWTATVTQVEPGSDEWASVVPVLHEKRLNPPDGEAQPDRWARESLVLRLTPVS